MKVLIKIEEYLPETQQIVVKFCSSQSEKSIDQMQAVAINLDNLSCSNTEAFLESLTRCGQRIIDNYEQIQHGEVIEDESFDISSLVGRTIERQQVDKIKKTLPMKRIQL